MDRSENLELSDSSEPCKLSKVVPSPLPGENSPFLPGDLVMTSLEAGTSFTK